jgi:hypothetical protein
MKKTRLRSTIAARLVAFIKKDFGIAKLKTSCVKTKELAYI